MGYIGHQVDHLRLGPVNNWDHRDSSTTRAIGKHSVVTDTMRATNNAETKISFSIYATAYQWHKTQLLPVTQIPQIDGRQLNPCQFETHRLKIFLKLKDPSWTILTGKSHLAMSK